MQKNSAFLKLRVIVAAIILLQSGICHAQKDSAEEFYTLNIYHYKTDAQQGLIDNYLQHSLIPALHRMQILKIGAFKAIANDTAAEKSMVVLIPLQSLDQLTLMSANLNADTGYDANGKDYIDADHATPPFARMETIVLHAFPLAPKMQMPALNSPMQDRIYELRSYESPTEKLNINKVQMFNEGGEVSLFKRLGFNAVFYAEVLAGSHMPNLMYMTTFNNMQERDAHWKAFGDDPFWKKLSAMPQYQNNVSKADITFFRPASYSDY